MRNVNRFIVVFSIVSLMAIGALSLVTAQDATPAAPAGAGTMVQCDSDLILNLYTAEHFFNFDKVRDQLMSSGTDTSSMVDLNTIDKGQFTPLFNAGTATSAALPALGDQQISDIATLLMMDDASLQSTLSGASGASENTLNPPSVSSESPECSQLRNELNRFFTVIAYQNFTGALTGTGATGTTGGAAPTPSS